MKLLRAALLLLAFALPSSPSLAGEGGPTPHVWLHYDYVVYPDGRSDAPPPAAIQMVVDAFATRGIVLHVDEHHAEVRNTGPWPGEAIGAYVVMGRTGRCIEIDRYDPRFNRPVPALGIYDVKDQYFHPTANHEWHYVLFGGAAMSQCLGSIPTSGAAEINGENLVIGMDSFRLLSEPNRTRAIAGTLMHELGHNFGLRHGGGDDTNYKPNYLSVMNYAFQWNGIPYAAAPGDSIRVGHRLDYSASALPTLDLEHLDEPAGIGAGTADLTFFSVRLPGDPYPFYRFVPASGPIDWNLDGRLDQDVTADLIDFGSEASLPRIVPGFDDWSAVRSYVLGTTPRGPKTIAHENLAERPVVESISPPSGGAIGGTVVTITGTHLKKADRVLFGAAPATNFTIVNERTILAVAPPYTLRHPYISESVDVTVVSADNPSPAVAADVFTYMPMVPSIAAVSPPSGRCGTRITIAGSNLTGTRAVSFVADDLYTVDAASFEAIDDRTLIATTPRDLRFCTYGEHVSVRVENAFGTGSGDFTFLPPAPPVIGSIDPGSGPMSGGTRITIRGSGFLGVTAVDILTAVCYASPSSFTLVDDATLVFTSPASLCSGTFDIRVRTNPAPGVAFVSEITPADQFTYLP